MTARHGVQLHASSADVEAGPRRLTVWADVVQAWPAEQRFAVPGPGSMLYVAEAGEGPAEPNALGTTAIAWKQQLDADQRRGNVRMTGDVQVVREPAGDAASTLRLRSDVLTATLNDTGGLAGAQVEGAVTLRSSDVRVNAAVATYDATAGTMTAVGNAQANVLLLDESGLSRGSARSVTYDVANGMIQEVVGLQGDVR